jgi:hypothetical protein
VVLKRTDFDLRYRVKLRRPTTVVLSAIVYPGWKLEVDGHSVSTQSYRLHGVPIFPEATLGAGTHTLDYSWSGLPS